MATESITNCLVTKLTASVEGGNLPRLGEFIVEFDPINNPQNKDMYICVAYITGTSGGYIRLLTPGTLREYSTTDTSGTDVGTQLDITDNRIHCVVVPNGGKIAIGNKYELHTFAPYSYYAVDASSLNWGDGKLTHKKFNAADLAYCTNLHTLSLRTTTIIGTLDTSRMSAIDSIDLSNSAADLTAELFMNNYTLTGLRLGGSSVKGDFAPVFDNWGVLLNGQAKSYDNIIIYRTEAIITVGSTVYHFPEYVASERFHVVFDTSGNWDLSFPPYS